MTPDEEIQRANKAREVLNNELFVEAFSQVAEALLMGMRSAAIVDERLRLRLLDRYELLYSVRAVLETAVETGKLASKQLELEAQQKSWLERARDVVNL